MTSPLTSVTQMAQQPTVADLRSITDTTPNLSRAQQRELDAETRKREAKYRNEQARLLAAGRERDRAIADGTAEEVRALKTELVSIAHGIARGQTKADEGIAAVQRAETAITRYRQIVGDLAVNHDDRANAAQVDPADYEAERLRRFPALRNRLPRLGAELPVSPSQAASPQSMVGSGDWSAALAGHVDDLYQTTGSVLNAIEEAERRAKLLSAPKADDARFPAMAMRR